MYLKLPLLPCQLLCHPMLSHGTNPEKTQDCILLRMAHVCWYVTVWRGNKWHPLILGKLDDKGFNIKGRQGISGRTLREKPHVVAP